MAAGGGITPPANAHRASSLRVALVRGVSTGRSGSREADRTIASPDLLISCKRPGSRYCGAFTAGSRCSTSLLFSVQVYGNRRSFAAARVKVRVIDHDRVKNTGSSKVAV